MSIIFSLLSVKNLGIPIPIKTASSLLSFIRVLLSEELNLLIELISTRIQFHLNKIAINKTREVERFIT